MAASPMRNNRSRLVEIYAPSCANRGSSPFSGSLNSSPGRSSRTVQSKPSTSQPRANGQPKGIPKPNPTNGARLTEELRRQIKSMREENQSLQARLKQLEEERDKRGKLVPSRNVRNGSAPMPRRDVQPTVQQLLQENRVLKERMRNFRADLRRVCNDFNGMASRQLLTLMKSLDTTPADPAVLAKEESHAQQVLLLKEEEIRKLKTEIRRLSQELGKRKGVPDSPSRIIPDSPSRIPDSPSRIPRAAPAAPPRPLPRKQTSKLPKLSPTMPRQAPIKSLEKTHPIKSLEKIHPIKSPEKIQSPAKLSPSRQEQGTLKETESVRMQSLRLLQAAIRADLCRQMYLSQDCQPQLRELQAVLRSHAARKVFMRAPPAERNDDDLMFDK